MRTNLSSSLALLTCLSMLTGCGRGSPPGAQPVAGAQPSTAATAAVATATANLFSLDDLTAKGIKATVIDAQRTLLCGGANQDQCVCVGPLSCGNGGCVAFEDIIAAFRTALAQPTDGRTVTCQRAETGSCDAFRYFDFNGDVERHEIRWFDAAGRLVAQRNWTDYPAYCEGRARTQLLGSLPKCATAVRSELICGEAGGQVISPLDDLLWRAGIPANK